MWSQLRGKQLLGARFRRQYSVGPYSIDFYCPEVRLAIELDGDSHFTPEATANDKQRQQYVESFGVRFLRFANEEVYANLEGVIDVIATAISKGSGRSAPRTPEEPPPTPPW